MIYNEIKRIGVLNMIEKENNKKGVFFSVEGVEGVGKSHQTKLIKEFYEKLGREVILTREPGGVVLAEQIRSIILSDGIDGVGEALLFAAARRIHLQQKVIPALNEGKIVICDRYVDSSLTYQGCARKIGVDKISYINEIATDGIMPDLTILLDMDVERSLERIYSGRQEEMNRLDRESREFYNIVRDGYLELAMKNPNRIKIVNADQSPDKVFEDIAIQLLKITN